MWSLAARTITLSEGATVIDDEFRRVPSNWTRIDLTVAWQVTHWASELGCTEEELRALVESAGGMLKDVRELLDWRRRG